MPKNHEGGVRGFHHFAEAWYAKSAPRDEPDRISIGIFYPQDGGGTSGEFMVEWIDLGSEPTPQLQVFDDGWSALALFADVLAKMAALPVPDDAPSITPAHFCDLLRSCGVQDLTKREDPDAIPAKCQQSPSGRHKPHANWWCEHCGAELGPHWEPPARVPKTGQKP